MVLAGKLKAETVTGLFIAYSDVACVGNLERNLKLEETCAENEVVLRDLRYLPFSLPHFLDCVSLNMKTNVPSETSLTL
jgi:hypothetical protein